MSRLTIILGNLRGGEDTFRSTIHACGGDIALLVEAVQQNFWHEAATFDWSFPEPSDWGSAFDHINGTSWRKLINVRDHWLGPAGQLGSGGLLLYMRYQLRQYIDVLLQYDEVVITRSDFLYCDKIPHSTDKMLIPDGEHYGGVTDRLIVIPKHLVQSYLDITPPIWFSPDSLYESMKFQSNWNIERVLDFRIKNLNLPFDYFPYSMVSIRKPEDKSRWSVGYYDARIKHVVKYASELDLVLKNYGADVKFLGIA